MSETMHGTPHIFCATPSKISTAGRWSGTTSDGPGQVQAGDAPDSRNYICVTSIVLLHYRSADPRACVPGGCAGVKTPRFSVLRGLTRRRGHGLDYSRRKDFGFGGGGVRSRTENPAYLLHFSRRAPLALRERTIAVGRLSQANGCTRARLHGRRTACGHHPSDLRCHLT